VEGSGRRATGIQPGEAAVKLSKLNGSDDIEGYLLTFERTMAAYEVDCARWVYLLALQLTGKA